MAGLFFTSMALPGLASGVLVARWSDRWRSRLPFIRAVTVWAAVGWLLLALSPWTWLTLATGAVFLSLGGALMGQVYAALHDVMTRDDEPRPGLITMTVRTGWSLGFVAGPVVGSALATLAGFRATFIAAAGLYMLCLVPLRRIAITAPPRASAAETAQQHSRPNLALLAFVGLCALLLSSQTIRNTYLPIHVTTHLGANLATYGVIVAISPVLELFTLPLAALLAQRIGITRLILSGMIVGAVEYALLSSSTALWQVYGTQAMDAWLVAVVLGLGVTYAQGLSPGRPGAASSLFFSSFNLSGIIGGVLGSVAVPILGVPHVFLLPAFLCAVTAGAFVGITRASRDQ